MIRLLIIFALVQFAIGCQSPGSDVNTLLPNQMSASATYPERWAASNNTLTVFVTPPITNEWILPDTILPNELISNRISLSGSPGEYRPATFTIRPLTNLSGLTLNISGLAGPAGKIPSSAVDIRVVKCWFQDSGDITGGVLDVSGQKVLVPELLLKDDTLVKVENGENYLKMTDGTYRWISDPTKEDWYTTLTPSEFPVRDSDTLQPVDLAAGQNKQFWVLVNIPKTAESGTYTGSISLSSSLGELAQIQLQLGVLPFTLSPAMLEYDLYYFGERSSAFPNGSISHQYKNNQQLQAEFQNMVEHGVYNVSLGNYGHDIRDWYNLGKLLSVKNAVGMTGRPLYYNWLGDDNHSGGLDWRTANPTMLENIKQATQDTIEFARQYGVTDVYVYGLDEKHDPAEILKFKPSFQAVHEIGGKVYIAGMESQGNYFSLLGNAVDIINNAGVPDAQVAARWHSIGKRIFCYGNPQVGAEKPDTYRRNYGLLLWQEDYDGAMAYAYQSGAGDIWNDFDSASYRDHVFTYPTLSGVIDTLQWEGWREAVTDIRYLTTLLDATKKSKAEGVDTPLIDSWVAELKAADFSTLDLDTVRSEMINRILSLKKPPVVTASPASNIASDEAVLNGNLAGTGSASTVAVSFEYGLTASYGSSAEGTPSTLSTTGSFKASISGLAPNTVYHYRAKAVGDGTAYSSDQTFKTSAPWWQFWRWLWDK